MTWLRNVVRWLLGLYSSLMTWLNNGVGWLLGGTKRERRCKVVMGRWLIFTVFLGAVAPLIFGPQRAFGFIQFFSGGELFASSAVIAADASGRFFQCLFLSRLNLAVRKEPWWAYPGALCSLGCLGVIIYYSGDVVVFRSTLTTQLPSFAYKSLAWFFATLFASGVTILGVEAL